MELGGDDDEVDGGILHFGERNYSRISPPLCVDIIFYSCQQNNVMRRREATNAHHNNEQ